jgi:transposase, IS30 family
MPHVPKRRISDGDQVDLWSRWKRGESLSAIGRALERRPGVVLQVLERRGGIAPPIRRRSPRVLSTTEREEISRALVTATSLRTISRQLGRAPSTISREVRRHGGRRAYRAARADVRAWTAARRPKSCRLAQAPALRRVVAEKLAADWSPEQIAGWLKVTYPADRAMQVSHETIYRSLFVQSRGVLKRALLKHLRRRRTVRRSHLARRAQPRWPTLVDAVSIRERPAAVNDRAIPGHWEGDLLAGGGHSSVATLVERQSRYVMLVRLAGKDTTTVVQSLTRHVRTLPRGLMASLTWDRGHELAGHKRFTIATDVQVYFCDPSSPWQRGSNENTNGLLRQYFPKGTDLSTFTQADLNRIARRLNQRPRKTLGYKTPAAMLAAIVASTT